MRIAYLHSFTYNLQEMLKNLERENCKFIDFFSSNKNVNSRRKQTVHFFSLLTYSTFKTIFNICTHKEIHLMNTGIGRFSPAS